MDYLSSIAEAARDRLITYFFSPPPPAPFDPNAITIAHINAARAALTQLNLPLEIADMILDHAEYWCRQRYTRAVRLSLTAQDWGASDTAPESCSLYLETGPLGSGDHGDELPPIVKPRKVVFRTLSCDQGWTSEPAVRGTYDGSCSWFDVSIFREEEEQQGQAVSGRDGVDAESQYYWHDPVATSSQGMRPDLPSDALERRYKLYIGRNPDQLAPWLARGGVELVRHGSRVTWALQRNLVAGSRPVRHEVEWREDGEEKEGEEEWTMDAKGRGTGFVRSLRKGDRIGVWARAMYPLWQNNVTSVEVDVHYSIF